MNPEFLLKLHEIERGGLPGWRRRYFAVVFIRFRKRSHRGRRTVRG